MLQAAAASILSTGQVAESPAVGPHASAVSSSSFMTCFHSTKRRILFLTYEVGKSTALLIPSSSLLFLTPLTGCIWQDLKESVEVENDFRHKCFRSVRRRFGRKQFATTVASINMARSMSLLQLGTDGHCRPTMPPAPHSVNEHTDFSTTGEVGNQDEGHAVQPFLPSATHKMPAHLSQNAARFQLLR
jgi:hypothetical protein